MAFVDEADLASTAPGKGAEMVGFKANGVGAVGRTASEKLRERVSLADFGGVPNVHADSTSVLNAAIAALGPNGGVVDIPAGDWWMNASITQDNILLRGTGGVGELSSSSPFLPCIRPYATGAGTTTLRIGGKVGVYNRRVKLENIVISGYDGQGDFGNQAEKTLWIDSGTINMTTQNVDLQDGFHTLHIEPSNVQPATGLFLYGLFVRNDVNDAGSRAIYVKRIGNDTQYVTNLHFEAKVNRSPTTSDGYWLEVDGTGTAGLVVHFHRTYVDHKADNGILMHGLETLECLGGLQLDPGAPNSVVIKRMDMTADPSRYIRGFVEGVGNQKIELSDNSLISFPNEPGLISYQPRLQQPFLGDLGYFSRLAAPYDTSIYYDFASATGPMRWNGCAHLWTNAGDATDGSATSGAIRTAGGISAAKNIHSGAFMGSLSGFKVNGVQVLAARQAAVTTPSGGTTVDSQARTAINALIARLQSHGLIA